jgi:hypothetical protein
MTTNRETKGKGCRKQQRCSEIGMQPRKRQKRKTYEVKAEVETGTESDKEENSDSD